MPLTLDIFFVKASLHQRVSRLMTGNTQENNFLFIFSSNFPLGEVTHHLTRGKTPHHVFFPQGFPPLEGESVQEGKHLGK